MKENVSHKKEYKDRKVVEFKCASGNAVVHFPDLPDDVKQVRTQELLRAILNMGREVMRADAELEQKRKLNEGEIQDIT